MKTTLILQEERLKETFNLTHLGLFPLGKSPSGKGMGIKMTNESTELTVVIKNGYQYNLSELPPMDSPAIAAAEEDILHGMQIDSIIQNLENVARLMFVAYNALGGTMVQAKMSGLQKKYLDLMDDSEQAIITFQNRSKEICVFMAKSYGWLLRGREKMAVAQFEKCASAAAEMAKKAEDLVNHSQVSRHKKV